MANAAHSLLDSSLSHRKAHWLLYAYCGYLLLPLYWLLNISLRTNRDIVSRLSVFPVDATLANFAEIFTNPVWYEAFGNSLTYVALNTSISVAVALPAAYAFSRYRFLGDKHLFFWLLTNRMSPPAVFLLPFFQLYSAIGIFDTPLAVALAHCLFTVPLAVWILEGFMSGVPKSLDEMARIDGHSTNVDWFAKVDDVHIGVRDKYFSGEEVKPERPNHGQVTHTTVGDHANASQRSMHIGVYLTPPRTNRVGRVEIVNDHEGWFRDRVDILPIIRA